MNKKAIVLFCLFLTLLTAFAACSKHSRYGVLVVDKEGMEHVIMTDANGVTVVNADGDLVEIMTDSGNKKPITLPQEEGTAMADQPANYETHPVTFPDVVDNGETVEDVCCELTVPAGWEQIGSGMLILQHSETGALVSIYSDISETLTDAIDKLNSDLEILTMAQGVTQTQVTIDGLPVTRTQYTLEDRTIVSYLLLTEADKVVRINCSVDTDKYDTADIDALVNTIHFK